MFNTKIVYKLLVGLGIMVFGLQEHASAQIVIGTPNLGFSQACASDSFNTYGVSFIFTPESGLNPSNQFSIELSDAEGNFTEPTVVYITNPGEITVSPATLQFELPEDTAGENYRLRIKSSDPVATSSPSVYFPAYFKLQDSPFTINNLVSSAAFCAGGSYLLTIDNPGPANNDSPLNYPSLTYLWYKETGPTTSVFVAEGTTLEVTQDGTYFVETNYGSCTSNSFSNRVTVTEVFSGEANAEIVSSLGNPFCPAQGVTTLTTLGGNSYQWFKDGEPIQDANQQSYQTDEAGTYAVQVDLGDCSASGFIELETELFDAEINVPEFNQIDEGESLFVMITHNAISPNFEWYLDDELITGVNADSYDVTEIGSYRIVVTETQGCTGSREFEFMVSEPFPEVEKIPNIVSPNGDNINDTWVLPTKYVSGTNTQVMIMNSNGKVVLRTNDYMNDWPQNDLQSARMKQIFYYVITASNSETRRGTITILK